MRPMKHARYWLQRLFDLSPLMIIIAVIGSLISAFTLSIYGFIRVLQLVWWVITEHQFNDQQEDRLSIAFIGLIDIFLIAVILLIVALGLYQLFIGPTKLPTWLRIHNLDELKHKIVGVLCVILGVDFVSKVTDWTGGRDIFYLGAAIALVLLALVLLLKTVDRSIKDDIMLDQEERAARAPSQATSD